VNNEDDQMEPWAGVASRIVGPIKNLLNDAENFRAVHQAYLDDIPADDLIARLNNPAPQYNWRGLQFSASSEHERAWNAVAASDELWTLAKSGRALCDQLFPLNTRLRNVLQFLEPGHRIDINWTEQGNFVAHVPWGLVYLGNIPPRGDPVDPGGFLGL